VFDYCVKARAVVRLNFISFQKEILSAFMFPPTARLHALDALASRYFASKKSDENF